VDLLTVQKVVIPLYEIFKFKIGALPYIIPSGEISFDICAKEIRKKFFVDGDAKLKNSRVELKDLKGLCLYTKEGELNFKDDDIEVNLKDVFLNNKPANIKGKTDLDSNFEFSVISQTQESSKVYEILKNTLVFDKKEEVLNKIKSVFGCIDFNLVVKGKLNSEDGLILNKTVFLDGNSEIKNNKIVTDYGVIDNYFAKLVFAENSQEIESKGRYGNSEFTLTGGIKNNKVSLDFNSDKLELKNFLFNGYNNLFENIILKVKAKYTGDIDNFDISKIVLDASIEPFYDSIKNLKVNSGKIVLNKGVFKLDKLNAYYKNNPIDMFLIISNLEKDYKINGRVQAKGLDLKGIEDTGILKSVPNLGECKFLGGNADINSDIKNNKLTGSLNIKDVKMTHVPSGMPINIISGNLILNNDKLFITAMNGLLGDMPILLNGKITEIFRKPYMDIYVNTKPKQDFLDNYVNKKRVYPLKLKGDILCTAKVVGYQDNYNVNAKMKLEENSSLYYLGATLGDREHAINLLLDVDVNKNNKFKINKFDYEKLILSQDNRLNKLPLMSASGQVKLVKEDFIFSNFVVKTHNPTDARVFNVIFKKPNIKQGQFNSDLKINGSMSSPRIVGEFSLSGIDIPFLNTTLKDISCEFKENVIKVKSTGEAL